MFKQSPKFDNLKNFSISGSLKPSTVCFNSINKKLLFDHINKVCISETLSRK